MIAAISVTDGFGRTSPSPNALSDRRPSAGAGLLRIHWGAARALRRRSAGSDRDDRGSGAGTKPLLVQNGNDLADFLVHRHRHRRPVAKA